MNKEALAALDSARVFEASHRFEDLALFHVPFDTLAGREGTEAVARRAVEAGGRVALLGGSGSGKSSVIAHCLGPLADDLREDIVPIRIRVGGEADETVTRRREFALHVIDSILRLASPDAFTQREKEEIGRNLQRLQRRAGKETMRKFSFGLPIWLADAGFAREVRTVTEAAKAELSAGTAVDEMRRVVDVFRANGTEPALVFEDADSWVRVVGRDFSELAEGFFSENVETMARELDCPLVIAVHNDYVDMPAYRAAATHFSALVHIPPELPSTVDAVSEVLARRIQLAEIREELGAVFGNDAVDLLVRHYEEGQSMREVVRAADWAIQTARIDGLERVDQPTMRKALAELTG